jgi:DNA primase
MPKYLNSSDNAIYHKGRHVFGADVARAAAAKAGFVIVAEGYTDVIALHQAGLRNTVGLMGTALTADQVAELARLAPVVRLALDADSAGQEAMVRAARVAEGKRLELRVVPLPAGKDPADLVAAEGAGAVRSLVDASVPFVRFQVERELARANLRDAEGKDHAIEALRPVFATLPRSALRDELVRLVASRTAVPPSLIADELVAGPQPGNDPRAGAPWAEPRTPRARITLDAAARRERAFLAQCIALPSAGAAALAAVDIEGAFTSDLHRRAATHLVAHLDAPARGLPDGDGELSALIAELTVAARAQDGSPAALEAERLKLELGQVERENGAARSGGTGDVAALAARRADLQEAVDRAIDLAIG